MKLYTPQTQKYLIFMSSLTHTFSFWAQYLYNQYYILVSVETQISDDEMEIIEKMFDYARYIICWLVMIQWWLCIAELGQFVYPSNIFHPLLLILNFEEITRTIPCFALKAIITYKKFGTKERIRSFGFLRIFTLFFDSFFLV